MQVLSGIRRTVLGGVSLVVAGCTTERSSHNAIVDLPYRELSALTANWDKESWQIELAGIEAIGSLRTRKQAITTCVMSFEQNPRKVEFLIAQLLLEDRDYKASHLMSLCLFCTQSNEVWTRVNKRISNDPELKNRLLTIIESACKQTEDSSSTRPRSFDFDQTEQLKKAGVVIGLLMQVDCTHEFQVGWRHMLETLETLSGDQPIMTFSRDAANKALRILPKKEPPKEAPPPPGNNAPLPRVQPSMLALNV